MQKGSRIFIAYSLQPIFVLKAGLTGGIGSGKSTVARVFELLGIPVYDADTAAKTIMNEDENLKALIIEHFGEEAYANGTLNRAYISSVVFENTEKLALLNSLVHPATIQAAERWMQQQNTPYVMKEAALIFESGSQEGLDVVIGVYAPVHLRIHRTMQRDNISREAVLKRISHQINEELKMKLCDFVLYNDEQQLLIPQVIALHEKLLRLSNKG
ncbi:dephospho-CoA kinase [Agriterribacter sp.]|uniref:dephospho-CoA kinase n=1 Tax=Agriterribacter sp. TaxID=2821509 RepID=UPI002C0A0888|nr:dephospho-CoA kinase [Agriterribacter sp.]HRO46640.1 dephospho-CoA kinase [Agriterribacter sp.]HRQ17300.1 dephospho-CoA kinase [Agriterribacter sp.]